MINGIELNDESVSIMGLELKCAVYFSFDTLKKSTLNILIWDLEQTIAKAKEGVEMWELAEKIAFGVPNDLKGENK